MTSSDTPSLRPVLDELLSPDVASGEVTDRARAIEAEFLAALRAPFSSARESLLQLVRGRDGARAMELLDRTYAGAGHGRQAAAVHRMIGDILRRRLTEEADREGAGRKLVMQANAYDLRALQLDPTLGAALAERLEAGLLEIDDIDGVFRLRRLLVEAEPDAALRLTALVELANDAIGLGAMDGAAEALMAAARLFPDRSGLFGQCEQHCRDHGLDGRSEELVRWALEHALWASADEAPEARARLLVNLADLLERRGAGAEARALYLDVDALAPNHPMARAWWEAHAGDLAGAQDLFRHLEAGVPALRHAEARAERYLRLGEVAEQQMGDTERAIWQYEAIVTMGQTAGRFEAEARGHLQRLLERQGRWDGVVGLLEGHIETLPPGSPERVKSLWELRDLHTRKRDNLTDAERVLQRLAAETPDDDEPLHQLASLYQMVGKPRQEARTLLDLIGRMERQRSPTSGGAIPAVGAPPRSDATAVTPASEVLPDSEERTQLAPRPDFGDYDMDAPTPIVPMLALARSAPHEAPRSSTSRLAVRPAHDDVDDLLLRLANLQHHELREPEAAAVTYTRLLNRSRHKERAYDALHDLFTGIGDYKSRVTLLERRLHESNDPVAQAAIAVEMADIAERQMSDPAAACEHLLLSLDFVSDDVAVLDRLLGLQERLHRWLEAVQTAERLLGLCTEPADQVNVLHHVGAARFRLSEFEAARNAYDQILQLVPDDRASLAALAEVYRQLGHWSELAEHLERWLRGESDGGQRHRLLTQLADLAIDRLGDDDRAVQVLRAIEAEFPADEVARLRRLDIHLGRGDLDDAEAWLRAAVEAAPDGVARIGALIRLADWQSFVMDDAERALATLDEAVEVDSDSRVARQRMLRILEPLGRPEQRVAILDELVERVPDLAWSMAWLEEAAELLATSLGRPDLAFEHLVSAHRLDRTDAQLNARLRSLVQQAGLWRDYLHVLGEDARLAESPTSRRVLQRECARILEVELGEPELAIELLAQLFGAQPGQGFELTELERLARAEPRFWSHVIGAYRTMIRVADRAEDAVAWMWATAEVQHRELRRSQPAFETLMDAYRRGVDQDVTLVRLDALAEEAGLWRARLEFEHERYEAEARPAQRVALLLNQAWIARQKLGDAELQQDALVAAFQIDPWNEGVVEALEGLCGELGRMDQVGALYASHVRKAAIAGDVVGEVHFGTQHARVLADHLGDVPAASALLARLCLLEPGVGAHHRAFGALALRPEGERSLPDVLAPWVSRPADLARLHRVLADQLFAATDAVFVRSAAWYARFDRACDHVIAALEIDPGSARPKTLGHVRRVLTRLRRWPRLAELLHLLAERETSTQVAFHTWLDLAKILEQRLGDVPGALDALERALDLRMNEQGIFLRAEQMCRSLGDLGRLEALLRKVLEFARWAHLHHDRARRIELLELLAQVLEQRGEPTRAHEVYQLVQSLDPTNEGVYASTRRRVVDVWTAQAFLPMLRARREVTTDRGEQLALVEEEARLLERHLDDIPGALGLLERIEGPAIEESPAPTRARAELHRLYRATGRMDAEVQLLERELDELPRTSPTVLELLERLATVYREDLNAPRQYAETLERMVAVVPERIELRLRLLDVYAALDDPDAVAAHLESLVGLVRTGEVGLVRWAGTLLHPLRMMERLAEVHLTRRGDPEAAARVWAELIGRHPDAQLALRKARVALTHAGAEPLLLSLYDEALFRTHDVHARVTLLCEMAEFAERAFGRVDQAIDLLERARLAAPTSTAPMAPLVRLYDAVGDDARLLEVSERWLDLAPAADIAANLCRSVADLHRLAGRLPEARRALDRWIALQPRHRSALARLHIVLAQLGEHDARRRSIRRQLAWDHDPRSRRGLRLELVELALDLDGDELGAIGMLERLVAERPKDLQVLDALARLLRGRGAWIKLARVLELLIEAFGPDAVDRRVAVLTELADVAFVRLDRVEVARAALRRALELRPRDLGVLERLLAVLPRREPTDETPVELLDVLDRLIDLHGEPAVMRRLILRKVAALDRHAPEAAFFALVEAHRHAESPIEDLPHLHRLARRANTFEALLDVLEHDALRWAWDDGAVDALVEARAHVLEHALGRSDEAFALRADRWRDAPEAWGFLSGLKAMARRDPVRWSAIVELLRENAAAATSAQARVRLAWEVASIEDRHLGDPARACQTLLGALGEQTLVRPTEERLVAIARRGRLAGPLFAMFDLRLDRQQGQGARLELLCTKARLARRLGASAEFEERQWASAFLLAPRARTPWAQLREAAIRSGHVEPVSQLVDLAVTRALQAGDDGLAVELCHRLATLHVAVGAADGAWAWLVRALRLAPHHRHLRHALGRLASGQGRRAELVPLWLELAAEVSPELAVSYHLEAGRILDTELQRTGEAVEVLSHALLLDVEYGEVRRALGRLYRDEHRFDALEALYAVVDEEEDDARLFHAWMQAAVTLKARGAEREAVDFLDRALAVRSYDFELHLRRIAALHRLGDWPRATAALDSALELVVGAPGDGFVNAMLALGVDSLESGRRQHGVQLLGRVLDTRPLRQDVAARLDTALADSPDDHASLLARRLADLDRLRALGPSTLLDPTNDALPRRPLPGFGSVVAGQTRALLVASVRLARRSPRDLLRIERALGAWLERLPGDVEALDQLGAVFADSGRWPIHVQVIRRRINVTPFVNTRAALLRHIADVEERECGRLANAVDALREMVALRRHDRAAQAHLGDLLLRLGREDEALTHLLAAIGPATEAPDDAAVAVHEKIAALLVRRERFADAVPHLEQALSHRLDDRALRTTLARCLGHTGDWRRHVHVLLDDLQFAASDAERAAIGMRIGALYRAQPDQLGAAAQSFAEVLALEPDHLDALRARGDACFRLGQYAEAATAYARLLDGGFTRVQIAGDGVDPGRVLPYESADEPAFVLFRVRLGVSRIRSEEAEAGYDDLRAALRAGSRSLLAHMALGLHAVEEANPSLARRHLGSLLEVHGATLSSEDWERCATVLLEACIALGDARGVIELLARREAHHVPFDVRAVDLAVEAGEFGVAVSLLESLPGSESDQRAALLVRQGDLIERRLADPARAVEVFTRAIEAGASDDALLDRVIALRRALGQDALAADLAREGVHRAQRRLDACSSRDPARAEGVALLTVRLLALAEVVKPRSPAEALDCLDRALTLLPNRFETLRTVAGLLAAAGDLDGWRVRLDAAFLRWTPDELRFATPALRRLAAQLAEDDATAFARALLDRLVEAAPNNIAVHRQRLVLFSVGPQHDAMLALTELRTLLALNEIDADSVRRTLSLFDETGRGALRLSALEVLELCRCLRPDERQLLRELRAALPELRALHFEPQRYADAFLPPACPPALWRLLELLGELIPPLLDAPAEAEPGESILGRRLSVVTVFETLARTLGVEGVDLRSSPGATDAVALRAAPTPVVVLPPEVAHGLANKDTHFLLAWALERSRGPWRLATTLAPDDFDALWAAALSVEPEAHLDPRTLRRWQGVLVRLPREQRRRLVSQQLRVAEAAGDKHTLPGPARWRALADEVSFDVGLFATGSPSVALRAMLLLEGRSGAIHSFEELARQCATVPRLRDALAYLFGDTFADRVARLAAMRATPPPLPPQT